MPAGLYPVWVWGGLGGGDRKGGWPQEGQLLTAPKAAVALP